MSVWCPAPMMDWLVCHVSELKCWSYISFLLSRPVRCMQVASVVGMHMFNSTGELDDNLAIGGFSPGDHSLDITVTDVFGQIVTHPRLTFTRPPLLVVECSANSLTVDCSNTTVVESQTCSIDGGTRFDCSLPLNITELAVSLNLTVGQHDLTVITTDVFAQSQIIQVSFNVTGKNFFFLFKVKFPPYKIVTMTFPQHNEIRNGDLSLFVFCIGYN